MIRVNDRITDFTLEVFQKDKISKTSLYKLSKDKWLIILFYPADFTFVCPTELEEAANYYSKFQAAGAEILSLSTDTVWVHKAWHDQSEAIKKVNYPMGADPNGKICQNFGTYLEDEGLSLRASFIINPEHKLKAYEMHDNDIGRSISEIFRKLQALQYAFAHKGEVCPVSWQPGEKTLKPGLKLVGKI